MKKLTLFSTSIVAASIWTVSCGSKGSSIANQSLLVSSTLSSFTTQSVVACAASTTACTPTKLEGRVYAAGAMLGASGPGTDGYSMTFMAATDEVINDPSVGKGGSIIFDVLNDDPYSGKASIPTEDSMPSNSIVSSIEFKFDYLDTTFALTGTNGVNGTYTIRTVYVSEATADDVTGTMLRGDKLIKSSTETAFKWCAASGCTAARPTSPYQQASVASWTLADGQDGGTEYTPVSFDIATADQKTFTHATLSDITKIWKVDLTVLNAVTFSAAPSTFDSVQEIVEKFSFAYAPPASDGGDATTSLVATFDIVDASTLTR